MSFATTRTVEFRDTDMAGIVHFSVFFTYMEEAEHALWRSLGTSVMGGDDEGTISWPRVAANCDYAGAARFEDELRIEVAVARLGTKSVTFQFQITRDAAPIATGAITCVCCRLESGQPPRSIEIPSRLREQLAALQVEG